MNPQVQMQFSDLNFTTPVVATDGNMIMIDDNGHASMLFFQMRMKDNGAPRPDIVAGVRFHNLKELKDFRDAINNTINEHEKKEK